MLLTFVVMCNTLGALMVARHDSIRANQIWFVTNPILVGHNFLIGQYEQAVMFTVYWILCVLGLTRWKK
jgi:hypothetical protein